MEKGYLPVIQKCASGKIPIDDILCVKQNLKNIKVVTHRGTLSLKGKISDIHPYLNDDFFQCHSYLVVNLTKIVEMSNNTIFFISKRKISLGRDNFIKTRKAYNQYLISLKQK